jgi:TANFOR domain-containing protein
MPKNFIKWVFLLYSLLTVAFSFAQTQLVINAQVIPPYSPYISTYVDNPNKLVLTITNTTGQEQRAKLWVRIAGDNGVSGTTSAGYKPQAPIVIPPFQTKVIDFSSNETKSYFDAENVVLVGITKAALIQNQALPEGTYTICVKAFDYNTGAPLSMDGQGCTAPFLISYIDPCMLIQPTCNSEIQKSNPQNILFTWSPPATAPGNIKYEFTLKVVPNNLNPNDVIKNPAFPVIFSTSVTSVTSLLYTNALPQLEAGKKYVWRVKCIDPAGNVQFKNNGYSEACVFNYKGSDNLPEVTPTPNTNNLAELNPPPIGGGGGLPFTPVITPNQGTAYVPAIIIPCQINGKLVYKWNSGPGTKYPMKFALIRLKVQYYLNENGTEIIAEGLNYKGVSAGKELAVTSTDDAGNFTFSFNPTFPFGKLEDNFVTGAGEFKHKGILYRRAVVEILYPHNQYYFSPTNTFTPASAEVVNGGELVASVKSCKLQVTVKRTGSTTNQMYGTSNLTLPDANVYLCRKPISIWSANIYPKDDGLPDNNSSNIPDGLGPLEVVAQAKTNSQGKVIFDRIVFHNNHNYEYYIFSDFDKNKTGFYNYVTINGPEIFKKYSDPEGKFISLGNGNGEMYYQTISMAAKSPRVAGIVLDKFDGKPRPGLTVLSSFYLGSNQHALTYVPSAAPQDEKNFSKDLSSCPSLCSKLVKRYYYRGSDGEFEFNDLSILYEKSGFKPIGPLHVVTAKSIGYDDKNHGVPEILFYGSQHYAEIKLDRGAEISGRVVDGESGKGLAANFYFLTENNSGWCNAQGYFSGYPARKGTFKQKLIISHPGYITDTIEVVTDKEKNDLGTLKLYTLKRRLLVAVSDAKTGNAVAKATVEILEVKYPCKVGSGQNQIYTECTLSEKTMDYLGLASFAFKNAGSPENNGQTYTVRISGPEGSNYETMTVTTAIPYSSKGTILIVKLNPATCISGYVYAGKGATSPVQGARIKMDVTTPFFWFGNLKTGELETTTDANGYYELRNVPIRAYPQIVRAMKGSSDLVGDSFVVVTQPGTNANYDAKSDNPKNSCITHNFHLTIYNGIDLSSLMGFPIEVTSLQPYGTNGAVINGYFVMLNGNDQFKPYGGASLQFENIKILPSTTIKNDKGIPAAMPETTPVNTNNNVLPLQLYGTVDGMVEDKKLGIYLDKDVGGKQYGVIKGKVKILNTAFNQSVIAFSDTLFLALPNESSPAKLVIPVINADKTVKNPANAPSGFKIANSLGNPVKFSLPGFPNCVQSDYDATSFFNGELNLTARIQTNITDITPSNLNIALSNIQLKKGVNPSINSSTPVSFNMGNWKLTSTDFVLDENGLKLNKGTIDAGVSIPFSNLGIRYNQLLTNATDIQLESMKLAGVHPVTINSTNKTFGLVNVSGGKKAWKIYAGPTPEIAATIGNLPGMGVSDKVELSSISLMSSGDQLLTLRAKQVTLKNILKFTPLEGTYISASENQFLIPGLFQLNLPTPKSYSTTLAYERSGSSLSFNLVNTQIVSFNKPTQLVHKFNANPTLTNGRFTYNGTTEEPGTFPSTKTTLYYTNDSVSVWIDAGQNIPINGSRKFGKAEGGMRIESGNWTPFWFSGDVEGMAGISDVQVGGKKQRMKFYVNGQVTADAQSLSVKNVETPFGNMSWVYDMPASRLTGHMDIDMALSSTYLKGQINTIVDGSGWFFGADGTLKVNGVGDLQFAGIFGDYPSYPTGINLKLGDFKCLPSGFNNKVNGFLFQAGIHKQVVPEIGLNIPGLLDVGFGVDVGLNTRLWKSFSEGGNLLGISLLARGHAYAHGSCGATCSDVSANANAEVSIGGTYNGTNGQFNINGCGSVGFNLEVEQCLGAFGLCSDACVGINTGEINLGINLNYNSSTGADMGIQFSSCSSVCP